MYHNIKKTTYQFIFSFTCLSLICFSQSLLAQNTHSESGTTIMQQPIHEKATVLILTTGGTIAGQAQDHKSLGYHAGQTSGEALIASVPALKDLANIQVEAVSQIGSQDMSDAILLNLLHHIQKAETNPKLAGTVITHGTDTMEETAFFLNEVLPHHKPIILVGAMRPAGYASADGNANLIDAVKVATSPIAKNRPVMIVMNDTIFSARSAQKTNTTNLEAFQAPNAGSIGIVNNEHVRFYLPSFSQETEYLSPPSQAPFPRVDIIYSHVQMDGDLIEDAVKRGTKGIILAGVGDGNTSAAALKALQNAANKGVVIVRSTRVGSGFVNRNVEINDDQNHFVVSEDLNPQKSRLLLQILLANHITTPSQIQTIFSKLY
ncbi:L-asparaginase/archaeal Glu-tRNAGln amidotransferase subunit D (AnsA) (PDB:1ZQ1) [Commensalibacter communis]|nr:L-asparaginase/archaeal Glu-tRNAGln amidotransferase subunit D (AnsA) (PDB:1ZQ1) [Commensalibacter communis]CAI3929991.1 L-asparaginase/archaeal Glu-tRNAGln amidotransferase subunit D (AnsA) (PDB:1ZQ1) [Commensalibacter communis]